MAKLPIDTRLEKLVAEDPEALARIMTRFMGETVTALGDLTFDENVNCQWHTFEVTVPSIVTGLVLAGHSMVSAASSGTTADTIINFETSEWDNYSAVTTGASWKFTAPLGGKFAVSAAVTLSTPASGHHLKVNIFKNGTLYKRLGSTQLSSSVTEGNICVSGTAIVDLAQGDYIDLRQTSSANLSYNTGADTYVSVTEIDTSTFIDPIPASCWPYDFLHSYNQRPRSVDVMDVVEMADNSTVEYGKPDWDFYMSSDGRPVVRIRNIPGLTPGRSYRITLLIVRD